MRFRPWQLAILWLAGCVSYCAVVSLLYVGVPETWIYDRLASFTGLIQGYEWDEYYALFLFLTSALINATVIWSVATLIMMKKRR